MVTLDDVRIAIREGDKKEALQLLKVVLKENPSAAAWYMAAKLVKDEELTVKYLRRALLLNPNHSESLAMMESLGIAPPGAVGHLRGGMAELFYEQAKRSPILRHFKPRQQLAVAGIMIILVVIAFVVVLTNLPEPADQVDIPESAPTARALAHISTLDLMNRLRDNGYNLDFEIVDEIPEGHSFHFTLSDETGAMQAINVLVYDSVSALIDDQDRIATYEISHNVVGFSNVVLIYPKDFTGEITDRLVSTFRAIMGA